MCLEELSRRHCSASMGEEVPPSLRPPYFGGNGEEVLRRGQPRPNRSHKKKWKMFLELAIVRVVRFVLACHDRYSADHIARQTGFRILEKIMPRN